jgi:hypothetical protein
VLEDEITECKVPSAKFAIAGDRVPVPVKDVLLDLHERAVAGFDTVARRMAPSENRFTTVVVARMLVVVDIVVVDRHGLRIVSVNSALHERGIVTAVAVVHVHGGTAPVVDLIVIDLHVLTGEHSDPVGIILPHGRERVVALAAVEPDPADPHVIAGNNLTKLGTRFRSALIDSV